MAYNTHMRTHSTHDALSLQHPRARRADSTSRVACAALFAPPTINTYTHTHHTHARIRKNNTIKYMQLCFSRFSTSFPNRKLHHSTPRAQTQQCVKMYTQFLIDFYHSGSGFTKNTVAHKRAYTHARTHIYGRITLQCCARDSRRRRRRAH